MNITSHSAALFIKLQKNKINFFIFTPVLAENPFMTLNSATVRTSLLLAALATAASQAHAASVTWNVGSGTTAESWNTSSNWSPSAVPTAGDDVVFSSNNGTQTVYLDANQAADGLTFSQTGTTQLRGSTGNAGNRTLTLGANGINASGGAVTIGSSTGGAQVAVALSASQTWNSSGAALRLVNNISSSSAGTKTLTLDGTYVGTSTATRNRQEGVISGGSGTIALVKNGTGLWSLQGGSGPTATGNASTINGTTTINGGTLQLASTSTVDFLSTVTNSGNFDVGDGTGSSGTNLATLGVSDVSPVNLVNTGTVTVYSDGLLAINGSNASNAVVSGGGALNINAGGQVQLHYVSSVSNVVTNSGVLTNEVGPIDYTGAITNTSTGKIEVGNKISPSTTMSISGGLANEGQVNVNFQDGILLIKSNVTGSGTITNISGVGGQNGGIIEISNNANVSNNIINNSVMTLTGGNSSLTGNISGTGTLTQSGGGTATLSGTNTYTGTTTVNNGTLLVDGTHTSSGAYTVTSTGRLGGNGTITTSSNVSVASSAKITGGGFGTVGTLTIAGSGNTVISGTYIFDVNYSTLTGDLIDVTGGAGTTLDLSGASFTLGTVTAGSPSTAAPNYLIKLLQWNINDTLIGVVADGDTVVAGTAGGLSIGQSIVRQGNAYYLIPEPASCVLLSLGSLLLLRRPSRRRGRAEA